MEEGDPLLTTPVGDRTADNPYGDIGVVKDGFTVDNVHGPERSGMRDAWHNYISARKDGDAWNTNRELREGRVDTHELDTVGGLDQSFTKAASLAGADRATREAAAYYGSKETNTVLPEGSVLLRGVSGFADADGSPRAFDRWEVGDTWLDPAFLSTATNTGGRREYGAHTIATSFANVPTGDPNMIMNRWRQPPDAGGVVFAIRPAAGTRSCTARRRSARSSCRDRGR